MAFQNRSIQDLAWILGSSSLVSPSAVSALVTEPSWFSQQAVDFKDHLFELDKNSESLDTWIASRRTKRLGHYFECLWSYWLKHNGRYRSLGENLQVRSGKQTLGELDFLVEDTVTGETWHWEVALKFYLNYGPSAELSSWYGLRANDKLELKLDRFENHQCPLVEKPEGRRLLEEMGIDITGSQVIMKGRLFYEKGQGESPSQINPDHLRAWWLDHQGFKERFGDVDRQWTIANKRDWLSPEWVADNDPERVWYSSSELLISLDQPQSVIGRIADESDVQFGFVLPNGWVDTLGLN